MLEYPCPLCKSGNIKRKRAVSSIYSDKSYALGSCLDCGHLFILDPPEPFELTKIYTTIYNYASHLAIADEKRWRFRKLKKKITRVIPLDCRIIDIGCGDGNDLEVFREFGYANLFGIEMDGPSVERCKEKGLDVFEGTFSRWISSGFKLSNKGPACIFLSNIIEHLQDVGDFLDKVNSILKRGDYLIIMVPNARALTSVILGRYWGWYLVPVHPHHFSRSSLCNLLVSKGFTIDTLFTRGADSLFFLSSLCSLLNVKSKSQKNSLLQRIIIRMTSIIFRSWVFIGDEELIVVAKKK